MSLIQQQTIVFIIPSDSVFVIEIVLTSRPRTTEATSPATRKTSLLIIKSHSSLRVAEQSAAALRRSVTLLSHPAASSFVVGN